MGVKKKVGIGFGIVIGLFFALIIAVGVSIEMEKANMSPEELQQYEEEREAERLLREQKAEEERLEREKEAERLRLEREEIELQKELEKIKEREAEKMAEQELQRLNALKQQDLGYTDMESIQERTEPDNKKLSAEEVQTVIAGFESYNESVRILLDACVAVESDEDFVALGQMIAEYGEEFLQITSGYGKVRDKLIAEGYSDHPELGPLMSESEVLVEGMTTCMDILAWEFGG